MTVWTMKVVASRLEEAAATLRLLPGDSPRGYVSFWPDVVHAKKDAYGCNDPDPPRLLPSPAEITRMDEALEWLQWLERDQVQIVWLHAEKVPRKIICAQYRTSRWTMWRKWSAYLLIIANQLNKANRKLLQQRVATTLHATPATEFAIFQATIAEPHVQAMGGVRG
ncbi:MAG: helix-turn-helix domain-containing protein [Magnetococcales bacterium]|nr:helix-turn-helix domain-containing protein [Magnetococcales bacterium]